MSGRRTIEQRNTEHHAFAGLPEELYALFGTGYLGYTPARQWDKAKRTEE